MTVTSGRWMAVAFLLAVACADDPQPPEQPRGVVLVVIDTLRADHLGSYGYERDTSPRMDALAREGVLFERALSPSPWTLPSLASLMTSLYPSVHGAHLPSSVRNVGWLFDPDGFRPTSRLHASRTTLAEILKSRGFATLGIVQGSYPSEVFGLSQGFDTYHANATPGIRWDVERALEWLSRHGEENFFVYLHTMEVHSPYMPTVMPPALGVRLPDAPVDRFRAELGEEKKRFERLDFDPGYRGRVDGSRGSFRALSAARPAPPPREVARLVSLYDRGIAYTDHWIGELLDGLEDLGLDDATAVVITSDHGEEFFEHGRLEHSYTYYEEMLRIPLLMRIPGEARGAVVTEPVSLVDVMPTLLDVLGIEEDRAVQGRSLRPLLHGEALAPRVHVGEASFEPGSRALLDDGWKYVRRGDGREELYDLGRDPGEKDDRCDANPAQCSALRERLGVWDRETAALADRLALPEADVPEVSDAMREQLRALGYAEP